MSTRRMLSRNITVSKKVAKVSGSGGTSDPWGKLLFTWLIPFTDDYGRFHADPHLLKGFIFPLEDTITPKHIEKMLAELDKRKLIVLYDDDGSSYLEIRNFEKFQTFRSDRKRQADFPAPTGKPKTPPGEPDDTPSEEEDKESEEKKKLLGAT